MIRDYPLAKAKGEISSFLYDHQGTLVARHASFLINTKIAILNIG